MDRQAPVSVESPREGVGLERFELRSKGAVGKVFCTGNSLCKGPEARLAWGCSQWRWKSLAGAMGFGP